MSKCDIILYMNILRLNTGKKFTDLTDDEARQIITDIFQPKKITCLRRHKKDDTFTCNIHSEYEGDEEDDGKPFTVCDELEIDNPWTLGLNAIDVDFGLCTGDYTLLKQFCIAKGIIPDWISDNPYMKDADEQPITVDQIAGLIDADAGFGIYDACDRDADYDLCESSSKDDPLHPWEKYKDCPVSSIEIREEECEAGYARIYINRTSRIEE